MLLDSQAPKKSTPVLARGKSASLPPLLPLSPAASLPASFPDDSTRATPTTPTEPEPASWPSPDSVPSQQPRLMPKPQFSFTERELEKEIERERYSTTALPVLLPWSHLRNRVTGMALAAQASGSVEAREFEDSSLQQQWRAVSVGSVASAPAVSYFFLQNRASGFVLRHSWWGSHVAASDCHVAGQHSQWELRGACGGFWAVKNRGNGKVLDHFFGISIQAYSEDELQYHHHWTITPAGSTGGKAHWEQEEDESGDKWCKAVQGGGEGSASLALVVDRLWSYVFNRDSGKALAVCEESVEAVDYEWGALEQQWRAVKTEKGYHVLQNRASGLVLDHYSGRRIGAYDNDFNNEFHKWQLRDIEGGVYVVLKNKKMGMVLDHYYWERLEAVGCDEKNKAQHWRVVPARQMAREGMGLQPSPEIESLVADLISLWERDSVPKGELKGVYLVPGVKPRHGIRVVKSGFNRSRQIHLLQVTIQGLAFASVAVPAGVEVGRGRIRAALRRSAEGGGEVAVVDSLDLLRVPEVEGPLVNLAVFVGVAAEQEDGSCQADGGGEVVVVVDSLDLRLQYGMGVKRVLTAWDGSEVVGSVHSVKEDGSCQADGGGEVVVVVDSLDLLRVPEVEGPLGNLVVFVGVAAEQVCSQCDYLAPPRMEGDPTPAPPTPRPGGSPRILVAVDESDGAEAAFRYALTLLRRSDNIYWQHGRRRLSRGGREAAAAAAAGGEVQAAIDARVDALLHRYRKLAHGKGVTCHGVSRKASDRRQEICEAVVRQDIELLVVGTRQLSAVAR
ncbi:unnamed protein product [Closterium sp. Yama58-4]|nr:unnamed protein product [Closterium sp. Yama58-4]